MFLIYREVIIQRFRSFQLIITDLLNFKNDSSSLFRNTVPTTNSQRKNVPKKNSLYKIYRKKFFFSKRMFLLSELENLFVPPSQKMFLA